MKLQQDLEWRYAAKAMTGDTISDEQRNNILNAMNMAPTSLGVQPIKFYVIRDEQKKKELTPIFNGQPQIEKSDCIILIASKLKYDEAWVDHIVDNIQKTRNLSPELEEQTRTSLKGYMSGMDDAFFAAWTMRQAYIALGFGLIAAADEQVDSTPMEGFNYDELNQYLKLADDGYQAAVALVVGIRDVEHDYLVNLPKVRLPLEEMVVNL